MIALQKETYNYMYYEFDKVFNSITSLLEIY